MDRRQYLKLSSLSALPFLLGCGAVKLSGSDQNLASTLVKPPVLKPGAIIRLVAPGGPVTEAKIDKARKQLEGLGLVVTEGQHLRARRGQHAGTDQQRLADLHAAFGDKSVQAIWAIRGGDGCSRLISQLNYQLIQNNPKILIGFSDITALLQAIYLKTGLVGFHGPIAYWPLTDYNMASVEAMLFGNGKDFRYAPLQTTTSLVSGKAKGTLAGGNLSILAALAGTPYALDCRNKLVFIEDVGEAPRKVDRMLTTLLDAADDRSLRNAKGIILGEFNDCDCERLADDPDKCAGNSMTLAETLQGRLGQLGIPVVKDFPFGHNENLCTFPVGCLAELDATNRTVQLLERPTSVA